MLCAWCAELVQKTNLWGYQGGLSRPYLKIVCALPNLVAPARSKLQHICAGGWRFAGAPEDGTRSGERALPSLGTQLLWPPCVVLSHHAAVCCLFPAVFPGGLEDGIRCGERALPSLASAAGN
jgi:hypothetical protein